ncbi:lysozyme inhibitor LprI family protein [Trinickia dinghuensis]|nr:hypothetical protein [Trinickia dinghuensis]
MSADYRRLQAASPGKHDAIRQAQMQWLQARDHCGADVDCLMSAYDQRIAALQSQFHDRVAYQPDDVDRQALEDLRERVDTMRKTDPVFPLEKVIDRLRIKTGMTTFSNVKDGDGPEDIAHFPTKRPSGVTADEWRALRASNIEGGGDEGHASYTLMKMDGDAQRELVIDSYMGGTGDFTYTSVLRRQGGKFVGPYTSLQTPGDVPASEISTAADGDPAQSYLYSINGRGANQSGDWIQLRGRVYAAYRVSYYGEDNVYLLRPLSIVGQAPKLTVRYRYQLSVPKTQKSDDSGTDEALDPAMRSGIMQALDKVGSEPTNDTGNETKPLCPIPDTVKGDDRQEYYAMGPAQYVVEVVANVPVWAGHQCYVGQVTDSFGAYDSKDGLYAQIRLHKPGAPEIHQPGVPENGDQTYSIDGTRTAVGTETTISKVEGDNGA